MARIDPSAMCDSPEGGSLGNCVTLTKGTYKVRSSGLEFFSEKELELYTELSLSVEHPETHKVVNFSGIVINCAGNRHEGFLVSLVFTNITQEAQLSLFEMHFA